MKAPAFVRRVRFYNPRKPNLRSIQWQSAALFVLGAVLGVLDKSFDTVAPPGFAGRLVRWIQVISTRISPWLLIAACIAAWSARPAAAVWKVAALFSGMLIAYYLYAAWVYGAFSGYLFLRWGLIVLASPLAACIAWLGRGRGWAAALCVAVTAAIPLSTGWPLAEGFTTKHAFDLAVGVALLGVLPRNWRQRAMSAPLAAALALGLRTTGALTWIFVSGM